MQGDDGAPERDYAYGTAMWTHKWNLMMNKMLDLGMEVYLTSGTNWATLQRPRPGPASQAGDAEPHPRHQHGRGRRSADGPAGAGTKRRAGAKFVTAYAYRVTRVTPSTPTASST